MALDHRRGAFAALDHIRIDRPLREYVDMPDLTGHRLEDADELFPYDLSLLLRVSDSRKPVNEPPARVHPDQVHPEGLPECLLDKISLVPAQKPVVHKDTDQVRSHSFVKKQRCDRGIDSARERE